MKFIKCSRGKVAIVDDWAHPILSQYEWRATQAGSRTWYAYRNDRRDGKSVVVSMHSDVARLTGMAVAICIDHRDGNGMNNQAVNLRSATTAQNSRNSRRPRNNTSGYKGVTWYKPTGKWLAYITFAGKRRHLGYYGSKIEAAAARDVAARKYHGEFARLNFPEQQQSAAAVA